ncbi:MAG: transporter substrate-binding domain-containing protein [Alteromonadaceae bacterium]|nr:transporter substrate-binding domain-containing protein [Alteromonadaceae bacterium]
MDKRLLKTIFFSAFIFIPVSYVESKTTLTLGYIEFPPFTYTNRLGLADGLLIKKTKKILTQAGFKYHIFALPTNRLLYYLKHGKIDLWLGINDQNEYQHTVLVGTKALTEINLNIYSVNGKKIDLITDLNNNEIIVIRGYRYGGFLDVLQKTKNNITLFTTKSHKSAFAMLAHHRAPYLLAYQHPADLALEQITIDNLTINHISTLPVFFIISKKTTNAAQVLTALDENM